MFEKESKKIDACKIKFDSNRLVFYPGETMSGNLHLEMNRAMDMEAIQLVCKGKMKVEWKENHVDEEGNAQEIEYESESKMFELKQKVYGNNDRESHPAGTHDYPFQFELPTNLFPSFEGEYGHIRYFIKVVIKKSWKKDLKWKKMFVVNNYIDVNEGKFNAAPGDEDQKTLGCLCCASGPLTLSANLNRSGFCGGESILVTAKVENNTSREMDDLKAALVQKINYEAKFKEIEGGGDRGGIPSTADKQEVKEIAKLKSDKIEEGGTLEWKAKEMALPPLIPTMSNKNIKVSYYVQVHLDVPMGIDMDFKLPVTIGTVPCQATYAEAETKENKFKAEAPGNVGPPPMSFLGQESMKPFQYSQLLNAKPKKMDKEWMDKEYIPLYTFAVPSKDCGDSQSGMSGEAQRERDNLTPVQ